MLIFTFLISLFTLSSATQIVANEEFVVVSMTYPKIEEETIRIFSTKAAMDKVVAEMKVPVQNIGDYTLADIPPSTKCQHYLLTFSDKDQMQQSMQIFDDIGYELLAPRKATISNSPANSTSQPKMDIENYIFEIKTGK